MLPYDTETARLTNRPGLSLQRWLARRLLGRFITTATQGPALLEIGTGAGHLALAAIERGLDYTGVEPTEAFRRHAISQLAESGLPRSAIFDVSLPNLPESWANKFDRCAMIHVLEHARDGNEAVEWMREIWRVLKPGGVLAIGAPDISSYRSFFYDVDWTHAWPTSIQRIESIGVATGFTVVDSLSLRGTFGLPFSMVLSLISLVFPRSLVNRAGKVVFGVDKLGNGISVAILKRLSWVVLEKPIASRADNPPDHSPLLRDIWPRIRSCISTFRRLPGSSH